jgi:hypothetical protein
MEKKRDSSKKHRKESVEIDHKKSKSKDKSVSPGMFALYLYTLKMLLNR